MNPELIIHNSVSLDGSLTGFEPHMGLHYQLASTFNADISLVGSNTARTGMELFLEKIPDETEDDFQKPQKEGILWAVPDSKGKLNGLLHVLRQSEYCKDAIVFVSHKTPADYIKYLEKRNYDFHVTGRDECDLKEILQILYDKYGGKTIITDAGSILSNLLIEQGLATGISLLIHPVIVGKKCYNMFSNIRNNTSLSLVKKEFIDDQYVWLVYKQKV